jgi:hypothetical protein
MILLPLPVFVLAFLHRAVRTDAKAVTILKLGILMTARNLLLGL